MAVSILIPVYNPDKQLLLLLDTLYPFLYPIVLVDDGSVTNNSAVIFKTIEAKYPEITVLKHRTNHGKGAALKTGFLHINNTQNLHCIVTADGDGQHLAKDILIVANTIAKHPTTFILGSRALLKNIPLKSIIGNRVISALFCIRFGTYIEDTQTGLRGIPSYILPQLLNLPGDRYEYETAVMIFLIKNKLPIICIPTTTVYINKNKGTNFNPIRDSLKIIKLLLTD